MDLAPAQPNLALLARWDGLALTAGAQEATRSTGQARLDGPLDGYALRLDGDLRRKEEQAKLTLSGRGSTQALDIGALQVQLPAGALEASGRVAWDPQPEAALDLRLSDFDPAWFAPAFPGSIRAELRASGALVDGAPRGQLDATRLEGTLRGQPLHGEASAQMEADGSGHGQLDLRLGGSHLRGEGRWGERLDARLAFSPLRLPDWLDDAEGELRGEILLRGSRRSPGLEAHIDAGPLALAGLATERLALRAELVEDSGSATLSLEAQRLTLAGQSFEHFSLSGEGDRGQHRVELALDGLPGRLGARIDGGLSPKADLWRGTLLALALEPRDHPAWRLREPAAAYDVAKIGLDPPVMALELDDVRIDIGDTDALRGDRYVRDGEHIARVADRFSPFLMATPESELERRTVPRGAAIVHLRIDGAEVAAAKIAAWQAMPVAKITAIDAADIRTAQHVVEVELADGTRIAWQLGHAADGWIARRTSPPLDYHLDARAVERFLAADADRDGD